jgi:predicted component of type VI protein secretion system
MSVRLVIVQGRPEGMEIPIPAAQFVIGRDPRCQLRPHSDQVSKLHCAILRRSDGIFVRDLKSTNGTFLNGDRVHGEVQVRDGDLLTGGPLTLAIKVPVTPAGAAAAPAGDAEDQAVNWLLEASNPQTAAEHDLGSKTTIIDLKQSSKPEAPATASLEPDTKVETTPAKPPEVLKPGRTATAEVAGDLLDRLLTPRKRSR